MQASGTDLDMTAIIDDLLELYTSHRSFTIVGGLYDSNTYLTQRIQLNKERTIYTNGYGNHNGNHYNSRDMSNSSPADFNSYLAMGYSAGSTERGTHGTIRFMIDPNRESAERSQINGSGRLREFSSPNGAGVSPWNGRS